MKDLLRYYRHLHKTLELRQRRSALETPWSNHTDQLAWQGQVQPHHGSTLHHTYMH